MISLFSRSPQASTETPVSNTSQRNNLRALNLQALSQDSFQTRFGAARKDLTGQGTLGALSDILEHQDVPLTTEAAMALWKELPGNAAQKARIQFSLPHSPHNGLNFFQILATANAPQVYEETAQAILGNRKLKLPMRDRLLICGTILTQTPTTPWALETLQALRTHRSVDTQTDFYETLTTLIRENHEAKWAYAQLLTMHDEEDHPDATTNICFPLPGVLEEIVIADPHSETTRLNLRKLLAKPGGGAELNEMTARIREHHPGWSIHTGLPK